ncbi:MAG: hypothetical protein O7I93_03245 [Gemmatimonadetes bacterium]|nr:hypothetical protein [Gemmatimonadota bacterium]
MRSHDRREFLKKLATGAVYTAPVMVSLAAPPALAGQGMPSMMDMGGGGGMNMPDPVFGPPPPGRG